MSSLIPFPSLQVVPTRPEAQRRPVTEPLRFPKLPNDSSGTEVRLPEGEIRGPEVDQLPRALHDDIVGLIRAVRGRFG